MFGPLVRSATVVLAASYLVGCGRSIQTIGVNPHAEEHPGELLLIDERALPIPEFDLLVGGLLLRTDADGLAELPALPPSYDVIAVVGAQVFAFDGLASRSPTVMLRTFLGAPEFGCTVNVPETVLEANQSIVFAIGVEGDGVERAFSGSSPPTSAYANWDVTPDATVSIDALLVDLDPLVNGITHFAGFVSESWSSPSGALTWEPSFGPVPFAETSIHLDINLPPASAVDFADLFLHESTGRAGAFPALNSNRSADFVVPDRNSDRYDLEVEAGHDDWVSAAFAHDVRPGSTVHITVPPGPTGLAPADGTENVDFDTEFSWAPAGNDVYGFFTEPDPLGPSYAVFTRAPSAHLPDATALGVPFPDGQSFDWSVEYEQGHPSFEAFVAGEPATSDAFSVHRRFTTTGAR